MKKANLDNLEAIEQSLFDLQAICKQHDIEYRVIGSTAIVGAIGSVHRIPADVDLLFNEKKKDVLFSELIKLGYKRELQEFPLDVLPTKLERFVKEKQIIEPRGGSFTSRGFEYKLFLLLPFGYKPNVSLVFYPAMFRSVTYKIGKTRFEGLSREALWVALTFFMSLLESLGDKVEKRQLDLKVLSQNLDKSRLREIIEEEPGLYMGKLPLVTTKKKLLASLIIKLLNFRTRNTT